MAGGRARWLALLCANCICAQNELRNITLHPPQNSSGPKAKRLVLVHPAKTAGSALQTYAYVSRQNRDLPRIHLNPGPRGPSWLHCYSTLTLPGGNNATARAECPTVNQSQLPIAPKVCTRYGATSVQHCVGRGWTFRDEEESFCVIRHPVDRIVSGFNMNVRNKQDCKPVALNSWVRTVLSRGHKDNYDIPQAAYRCDMHLCFKTLRAEFDALLNRSWWHNESHASSRVADWQTPGWQSQGSTALLPMVRHGARGHCNASHLDRQTHSLVVMRYYEDLVKYSARCDPAALPSALADAVSIDALPPPWTWAADGLPQGRTERLTC